MSTYDPRIPLPEKQAEEYARDLQSEAQYNKVDLEQWFMDEINRAEGSDKSAELALQWKLFRLESFYHNRQFMYRRLARDGQSYDIYVADYDSQTSDEARMRYLTNNQIRRDGNTLIAQCATSNPVWIFEGRSEADSAELAASFAKKLWTYHRDRYLGISFRLARAKMGVLDGNYFGKWSFDPDAGSRFQDVTEIQKQDVDLGSAMHKCPGCDKMVNIPDAQPQENEVAEPPQMQNPQEEAAEGEQPPQNQPCPSCGQTEQPLEMVARNTAQKPVEVITGQEPLGDFTFDIYHPRNVKIDLTARYDKGRVKKTGWILHRYVTTKEELEGRYPYAVIKASGELSQAALYQCRLQSATGYLGTEGGQVGDAASYTHQVEARDHYMDPCMYERKTAKKDCKIGNVEFKAGDKLIDKYPTGIVICATSDQLLAIDSCDKNSTWTWGVADIGDDQCYADGVLDDAVDHQIAINYASRFNLVNLGVNADSQKVTNPDWINASEFEPGRGRVAQMKPGVGSELVHPALAVHQTQGTELVGAMQTIEYHEEAIHQGTGSSDELGGDTDPANRTMGGQQIAAGNARRRLGPLLQIGVEWEMEVIYQCLELVKEHYGDGARYKGLIGKYGSKEEEAFLNCNIRDEIDIRHQEGSEFPRSQEDDLNSFQMATSVGQLPGGIFNPMVPKPVLKHALKLFNQPIDINDIWPAARLASYRLEKLKALFDKNPDWHGIPYPPIDPMTQQPLPAMGPNGQPVMVPGPDGQPQPQPSQQTIEFATLAGQIVSSIPIRPKLDPHAELMEELKSWSLTDEGINACPLQETVVSMWYGMHENMIQQPQQEMQQQAIESQQAAQQKDQQMQAQLEAAKNQHAAQLDAAKGQQQAQLDGEHANADAKTQIAIHAAKTAIDLHAAAQQAKIDVAKEKAMPKPPKPGAKT